VEVGQLFATGDSDEAIRKPPSTAVLDVNLKGTVFVARVAVHYLRRSLAQNASSQKDASILLVSSVVSFGNWPGLFQYSASKHGVMGLFHSTKDFLFVTEGIRVNVVLPNMTGMSNNSN
jgi:NAD(P)-dependent dehydrogenase (short-subunit alcohol dehydrogenase family)